MQTSAHQEDQLISGMFRYYLPTNVQDNPTSYQRILASKFGERLAWFLCFVSFPPENDEIMPEIRPRPIRFTSLPVYHALIILSFECHQINIKMEIEQKYEGGSNINRPQLSIFFFIKTILENKKILSST